LNTLQEQLQTAVGEQFRGAGNGPPCRQEEQVFHGPALQGGELIAFAQQVFGQSGRLGCSEVAVHAGVAQIGVDEEGAAPVLPHHDLGEIGSHERLPFFGKRAGYQQAFQRHFLADLVETVAQGAELFRPDPIVVSVKEEHGARIRSPFGLRAAGEQRFVIQGGGHGWHGEGPRSLRQRRQRYIFALLFRLLESGGLLEGGLDVGPRGSCSFLFGAFQSVMDAAHSFLSLGRSCCSDWRSRSASVAKVRKASTRSNFSDDGGADAIMAPAALSSARSKSRATESTTSREIVFRCSTNALTRQCSQSRLMMRGMPCA